jgi:hypothetical protein
MSFVCSFAITRRTIFSGTRSASRGVGNNDAVSVGAEMKAGTRFKDARFGCRPLFGPVAALNLRHV